MTAIRFSDRNNGNEFQAVTFIFSMHPQNPNVDYDILDIHYHDVNTITVFQFFCLFSSVFLLKRTIFLGFSFSFFHRPLFVCVIPILPTHLNYIELSVGKSVSWNWLKR